MACMGRCTTQELACYACWEAPLLHKRLGKGWVGSLKGGAPEREGPGEIRGNGMWAAEECRKPFLRDRQSLGGKRAWPTLRGCPPLPMCPALGRLHFCTSTQIIMLGKMQDTFHHAFQTALLSEPHGARPPLKESRKLSVGTHEA
jgi:hypothetical protein